MADSEFMGLWSETSERAVLGQLMLEPWTFHHLRINIKADTFHNHVRRYIYEMMMQIADSGSDVEFDQMVLQSRLEGVVDKDTRIMVSAEILECANTVPLPGTFMAHVDNLNRLLYRRRIIELAENIGAMAYGEGPEEDIEPSIYQELSRLSYAVGDKPILDPKYRAEFGIESLAARQQGTSSDVPSGYAHFDKALGGGFVRGTSTTITAITGGYKTTFGLAMARRQALKGVKVLVVSLEMPEEMLFLKDLAAMTGINMDDMRSDAGINESGWDKVMKAANILQTANYYTWPYSGNVEDVYAVAQDMKNTIGLDEVIVDYLQIVDMSNSKSSRYEHVSNASRILTKLAKDLDVVTVSLAQMNRSIYSTANLMPSLSLLKESGSIENDSTNVIGLYDPYGVSTFPGKYVPKGNEEWTEDQWLSEGATRSPVLDAERGNGSIPSVHELQLLMMKARYGTNDQVVRLGVHPERHDVFDPYGDPALENAVLPSIPKPAQIEQYHMDINNAVFMQQAAEFGPGLGDPSSGPSFGAGVVSNLQDQRSVTVSENDMI